MSTFFYFKEKVSRQELESYGVLFLDGQIQDNEDHTWIVSSLPAISGQTNYLHPYISDGMIYGFKRYGTNHTEFLTEILDQNMFEYVDEYTIADINPPTDFASKFLGIDLTDKTEEKEDSLTQAIWDNDFYCVDYYYSPNKRKFVIDFLTENRDGILKSYEENMANQN